MYLRSYVYKFIPTNLLVSNRASIKNLINSTIKTMSKVLLHKYLPSKHLISVEHLNPDTGDAFENLFIFIGGLTYSMTSTSYVEPLTKELASIGWGLSEVQISSCDIGWGTGSLSRDAEEITEAVRYYRSASGGSKKKIVLMGHSTGCQDIMYYLTQQYENDKNTLSERPSVDGAILQAGASDREAFSKALGQEKWQELLDAAKERVANGQGKDVLPYSFCDMFKGTPIDANRWVDLNEVRGGEDFFSSDLNADDHAKTFGKVNTKLLILYSGKDQYVPETFSKEELVDKWKKATDPKNWSEYSGIVPGATHGVDGESDPGAREDLFNRVKKFAPSV